MQNPVAAQKEKHLRDGIMVENQLEHAYTYTHIRKFQMFDHGLPEIMSGALQTSQLSDKGREPKGRVDYA